MFVASNVAATLVLLGLVGPPEDGRAEELAQQALVEYRAKRYEAAARLFLEAHEISGNPTPLRNAAKALELAGRLDLALVHWSVYATLEGITGDERAEAREHVLGIRRKLAERQETPDRGSAGRPDHVPPDRQPVTISRAPERAVGYAVLGTGIAILGTGALLWGLSAADLAGLDEKLAEVDAGGRTVGIGRGDAQDELDVVNARRTAGIVLTAVGAAATVFGTVFAAANPDRLSPWKPPVAVSPLPGGAVLLWRSGL